MKPIHIIFLVLAGLFLTVWILASIFIGMYNNLVATSAQVDNAWAEVDTQQQRRFDLVPNLVGATKGALTQEQEVFGAIADARAHYANAKQSADVEGQVQATNQYESALARLLMVVENYPQLRSLVTVNRLMDELAGTENRILIARNRYNVQVKEYNVMVKQFPTMFFANMYGYGERSYYESSEGADQAPVVDLNTN